MKTAELPLPSASDLTAALTWNARELSASNAPSARLFLRTLDLHLSEYPESFGGLDPLADAVAGLAKELQGDRPGAVAIYERMALARYDPSIRRPGRLLGLSLLAWTDTTDIRKTASRIERVLGGISDQLTRVVCRLRLSMVAANNGEWELCIRLRLRARRDVPEDRPLLAWRVDSEIARARNQFRIVMPPVTRDRADESFSIIANSGDAARKALTAAANQVVVSPWARSWTFGLTPSDSANAAVMQAEWAGASWLLAGLQLQAASQIIVSGARSSPESVRAAAFWILGRGQHLGSVLNYLESRFEANSFNELFSVALKDGKSLRADEHFLDAVLELWDLLTPAYAERLMGQFPMTGRDTPEHVCRLWALAPGVAPRAWNRAFLELDEGSQRAVLNVLPAGLVDLITQKSHRRLMDLWLERPSGSTEEIRYDLGHELRRAERRKGVSARALDVLRAAPALDRLRLIARDAQLSEELGLPDALDVAVGMVEAQAAAARRGTMSFGGPSPMQRIAVAVQLAPPTEEVTRAIGCIAHVAQDSSVVADLRADALLALRFLAQHPALNLDLELLKEAASVPADLFDSGANELITGVTGILVAMLRGSADPELDLLALARHEDARVRELAVDSAARMIGTLGHTLLDAAVLSSLYDPADAVRRTGLSCISRAAGDFDRVAPVVSQRMLDMFAVEDRRTRTHLCGTAEALTTAGVHNPALIELMAAARADRSFQVRRQALHHHH